MFCCLEVVGTIIGAILIAFFFIAKGLWWVICKIAIFIWWILCGIGGCIGSCTDVCANGGISGCSSDSGQAHSVSNAQTVAKAMSWDERKRVEAEQKREEAERKREDTLRDFALKEAPKLWQTYQALGAAIDEQRTKIENLRSELRRFGRDPDMDDDVKGLVGQLGELVSMRKELHEKLEKAYLQFLFDAATPDKGTADDLRKKALDDGLRIAEEVERRFGKMQEVK